MDKHKKSTTYNPKRSNLDQLFRERKFRDFWSFEYICRHVEEGHRQKNKAEERDRLMDEFYDLIKHYTTFSEDERERFQQLLDFSYELVYAFHRQTYSDGFVDLVGESELSESRLILEALLPEELSVVEKLHDLSYEHGFLITDLWSGPTEMGDFVLTFIRSYPDTPKDLHLIPRFSIPKKGRHIKGIQIAVPPFSALIDENWDLAVYFKENDRISHVESSIGTLWNEEGRQIVGDEQNHRIALYIDRDSCKPTYVLSALKLQHDRLKLNGPISSNGDLKNPIESLERQIRLEEDMRLKRWSTEKNNVRRAVGLYLWDEINYSGSKIKSRKIAVENCIDFIKKENAEALELYFSNYNKFTNPEKTERFGDLEKHHQTVVRELEADYDLAAYCIEKAEYCIPSDVKTKK